MYAVDKQWENVSWLPNDAQVIFASILANMNKHKGTEKQT